MARDEKKRRWTPDGARTGLAIQSGRLGWQSSFSMRQRKYPRIYPQVRKVVDQNYLMGNPWSAVAERRPLRDDGAEAADESGEELLESQRRRPASLITTALTSTRMAVLRTSRFCDRRICRAARRPRFWPRPCWTPPGRAGTASREPSHLFERPVICPELWLCLHTVLVIGTVSLLRRTGHELSIVSPTLSTETRPRARMAAPRVGMVLEFATPSNRSAHGAVCGPLRRECTTSLGNSLPTRAPPGRFGSGDRGCDEMHVGEQVRRDAHCGETR